MDPATTAIAATGAVALSKPVVKVACQFLENIGNGITKEVGEALSEDYKAFRASNLQTVSRGAASKLRDRGVEAHVPAGFLWPALNRAADVNAPELQELWAELLANGVASEEHRHPQLMQTLASMDAADASYFAEQVRKGVHAEHYHRVGFRVRTQDKAQRDHLLALGLIEAHLDNVKLPRIDSANTRWSEIKSDVEQALNAARMAQTFSVTGFGESFARAVGLLPAPRPATA